MLAEKNYAMEGHDLSVSLRDITDPAMLEARPVLHEIFQQRALRAPEVVAVRFEDSQVTYGELNERVDRLARYLVSQGLGWQDKIAIWLEPGHERVVALLAVLRIGAVACPLHLALPAQLLVSVMRTAAVKALLTSGAAFPKLSAAAASITTCRVLDVADVCVPAAAQSGQDVYRRTDWADLAYLVHTSGSTGAPKAVAMSHKAFSYEIAWQVRQSVSSQPPTTLQFSSLGFDLFLTEVMSTLCQGGTLVVATEQMRGDSASLFDAIKKYRIERLLISRVVLQGLAEEVIRRDEAPVSLQEIMCTGEQLTITAQMRQLFKRHSCLFYNEYGMSEAPVVSAHTLSGDPNAWPDVPPVGKVAQGSEVFILDANMNRVAPGEQGEVYVAGNFLADGYWGADDEVSAKFITNPFGSGLIFKSGDLGRFSSDQELVLAGRLDSVVNIRGIRIGLGEIEALLRNHPLVKECAVTKIDDARDARLAAYVALKAPDEAFESVLREWLAERIATYAIPAHFIELQEFPKTPSGKIDRRALPSPDDGRPKIATPYLEARTRLEMQLLVIWKNVLRVASIGVKDKVFDLGGTSLSIQELVREISRELNVRLSATDLFTFPSVETLARHISTTCLQASDGEVAAPARNQEVDPYLQRRMKRKGTREFR